MGNPMSIVSGLLGGGGKGINYTPQTANLIQPATADQANAQYGSAQSGIQSQQGFLNAVNAQNGLKNQQNVFGQLQGVANGTGPNPAQAMLANSTGQNVANQAALMAGQRGSSANAGLIARQAAQQGAATQQQAAGQGAALQAQQSLGALNQLGGIATNQANQQANATNAYTNATQAEQQQINNALASQNQQNVQMQTGINNNNTALAGGLQSAQVGAVGGIANSLGPVASNLGSLFGGGSTPSPDGTFGSTLLSDTGDTQGAAISGGFGKASMYADGGDVDQQTIPNNATPLDASTGATSQGAKSALGQYLTNPQAPDESQPAMTAAGTTAGGGIGSLGGSLVGAAGSLAKNQVVSQGLKQVGNWAGDAANSVGDWFSGMTAADIGASLGEAGTAVAGGAADAAPVVALAAKGGRVPAMVSPGEQYIPPKDIAKVKAGANPLKTGERIPGKPKFPGNDYRNDTVPKTLQAGGLVIPNEVMQAKDPHKAAANFVAAHLAQRSKKLPSKGK